MNMKNGTNVSGHTIRRRRRNAMVVFEIIRTNENINAIGIIRIKPSPRDRKGNNSKDKSGERRANMDDPCSDDDVDGGDVEDKSDDDCEGDASRDVDIHNSNNDNSEERWYSTATILLHLAAIGDLYKHQCEDRNNLAMDYGTVPAPKTYLQPLIDVYRVRMSARKRSTDTDFGSIDFTQNPTSIVRQLMKRFWMRNVEGAASLRKRRLKGLRDRADVSLCFFMMFRSEVTRQIRLPDLFAHDVEPNRNKNTNDASCREGQFVLGVVLMMRQGKTNKDGKIQYGVAVRNKEVDVCPVGALAFYLLELWSVSGVHVVNVGGRRVVSLIFQHSFNNAFFPPPLPFFCCTKSKNKRAPDLTNPKWTDYHLLAGNKPMDVPMTYNSQFQAQVEALHESGILDKGTVTHLGRKHGSRFAHMCGSTVEAIAKHGNWASNRLSTHYLEGVEPSVALRLAGFDRDRLERFWLARNTVIPSIELQRQLFPFIEDACSDTFWRLTIDNIMRDCDVFHGREELREKLRRGECKEVKQVYTDKDMQTVLSNEVISRKRHLSLLAHLRKVILQDAAVILSGGGAAAAHPVFDHPVFKTPAFQDFQQTLLESMRNPSPLTDSLASATPIIQLEFDRVGARLGVQDAAIRSLQQSQQAGLQSLHAGMNVLAATLQAQNDRTASELKDLKRCIGNNDKLAGNKRQCLNKDAVRSQLMQALKSTVEAVVAISEDDEVKVSDDVNGSVASQSTTMATAIALLQLPEPDAGQQESRPLTSSTAVLSRDAHRRAALAAFNPSDNVEDRMRQVAALVADEKRARGETQHHMPLMPECKLIPRPNTLDQLWQEWVYHGVDGSPSIAELNRWFGSAWRGKDAQLYKWKKDIVHSVLRSIPAGLQVDKSAVNNALAFVRGQIDTVGSIDKYYKALPKAPSRKYPKRRE